MKMNLHPAVAAVIIVVFLAVVIRFGWKSLGPQHEQITKPIDMGKMMSKDKMAPPPRSGNPMSPRATGAPQ
jgi:energy-converting hydrogenase Eha subunit F